MRNQYVNKDRRHFIKKGVAGLAGVAVLPSVLIGDKKEEKTKKFMFRTLGKTGLKLPIVSMGVMNADNPELVRAALDAGIVLLDTAHGYQRGRNEEMIGTVIKDRPRDSYIIATKVPGDHQDRKTGLFTKETKAESFIEKFHISLKRLGLEYVDILYLHSVVKRDAVLFEPLLSAMVKLKKEGKVRFIGVSTHRNEPEVLRAAADSKVHDVVLTAYNFLQPHLADVQKAISYAASKGLGIVAMKTQAGVYWDRERQHQINMKAALKWALQNENIHTAIPGFTTFDQMKLDLTVLENLTLTQQEKIDLKLDKKLAMAGLYCQQCGSCISQCRENLEIPTYMRSYMYAYGYRNLGLARDTLESLNLSDIPCSNCSTCKVNCPMGFDVKNKMLDIIRIKAVPEDFLV
jgi:predicted aldo/keto reductase-like oxidoreductase